MESIIGNIEFQDDTFLKLSLWGITSVDVATALFRVEIASWRWSGCIVSIVVGSFSSFGIIIKGLIVEHGSCILGIDQVIN